MIPDYAELNMLCDLQEQRIREQLAKVWVKSAVAEPFEFVPLGDETKNAAERALRQYRIEHGLCIRCGKDQDDDKNTCSTCRAKRAANTRRWRRKQG